MRAITALLLLCVSAFSFAAPAEEPQSNGNDQLAQLLFNDPNSPRTGAKEPKLTIVSFTDYNCPYCKQFGPLLQWLRLVEFWLTICLVLTRSAAP